MSKAARDEFLTGLAEALDVLLAKRGRPRCDTLLAALDVITEGWSVTRNRNVIRDDAGYQDGNDVCRESVGTVREGSILEITTPWRPETEDEQTDREARAAARSWAWRAREFSYDPQDPGYDNGECPPPPVRVGVSQLLDQGLWWRARVSKDPEDRMTLPIRLADMTHDHRLALLAFLRRNAPRYKLREDWAYASTPGPSGDMASDAFETECDRQWETPAGEWLETRPLVRALVHWTTPYGESPLTWRPMDEAPRDGTDIMVRWPDGGDLDEPDQAFWSHFGHCWHLNAGTGSFQDDAFAEWRELRDDEKPAPVEYCDHEGYDGQECGDCGAEWHPCDHGGTRGSDYCSLCEQE